MLFVARNTRSTQTRCVGRMQCFGTLQQVVNKVTTLL